MRNSLILIFVIFCSLCDAQNTVDSLKVKSKKFFVGVNFSSNYCYRTLETSNSDRYKFLVDSRNESEKPRFGYSFGASSFLKISKYLEFGYGIQYSLDGYQTIVDYSNLNFGDMVDPRYGFVYTIFPDGRIVNEIIIRSTYNYIEVPIKMGFRLGKKRLKYYADAGISISYLFKNDNNYVRKYKDGDIERFEQKEVGFKEVNKLGVFGTASIGFSYDLSKRLFIQGTPTFRYGFIETHDSQIDEHLWSAGFNCSLYYNLISSKK
jgi:hypothetical protein